MSSGYLFPTLQYLAWIIALLELIFALYALVLNYRHPANRHLSAYLLLLAVNTFAIGQMVAAQTIFQALRPSIVLAITSPAIQAGLLSVSIVLLKPNWQRSRMSWLVYLGYILCLLPGVLTVIDIYTGSRLWYSGSIPAISPVGYQALLDYTHGSLESMIWITNFYIAGFLVLFTLFYLAVFDKQVFPKSRALAWLLLGSQIIAICLQIYATRFINSAVPVLITSTLFAVTYGYASFEQMVSERRLQRGRLQVRLTALVLVVTIPIGLALVFFMSRQAESQLNQAATDRLRSAGNHLAGTAKIWLDRQEEALTSMVLSPDIKGMDPTKQLPVLRAMADAHPWMIQASTTDAAGKTLAHSDILSLEDYSNQKWYQAIKDGAPVSYDVMINPYIKTPALMIGKPITNDKGDFAGVGLFASSLSSFSTEMQELRVGEQGEVYLVDDLNRLIVHPDRLLVSNLTDMSIAPPVIALRNHQQTQVRFIDSNGDAWQAYIQPLDNNWAVVSQQPESELFAASQRLRNVTLMTLIIGGILLFTLVWLTIRQSIQPINTLTGTAAAIAAGDITRMAPVESEDELGVLARAFNSMTSQLRNLISGLELRVAERTEALQKRAIQLEVTAEVARESAGIHELQKLLDQTTRLISDRFSFYHCGIFLLDDPGEFAVLRAASSEGGARMLVRGHKLRVGQTGIVGYAAAHGEPRIALDVGTDAVYFNNPDLPQTRSEAALPLIVRDRVIGVLDVQSTQSAAFEQDDIEVLQVLANQTALAIDSARLFEESQQSYNELQSLYGLQLRETWQERLERKPTTYIYDRLGVQVVQTDLPGETWTNTQDPAVLNIPIELRGLHIGTLVLRREPTQPPWAPEEIEMATDAASQIALALDNARLVETVQRNAYQEKLIGQIASKTQSSLALENVMKIAVEEIGHAIGGARVQIQLGDTNGGKDESPHPKPKRRGNGRK